MPIGSVLVGEGPEIGIMIAGCLFEHPMAYFKVT
jgi:hypothetical protein